MSGQPLSIRLHPPAALRDDFILAYIEAYWQAEWTSPTVRELGKVLGLSSPATVHKHLERLEATGELEVKRVSPRRVLYRTRRSVDHKRREAA